MQKSTNKLTKHELHFAASKDYPKIKHTVVEKIGVQFAQLGNQLIEKVELGSLSANKDYKITKGENLLLMPYLVLDYPKISGHDFNLVCRTLFWWGHYFSLNIIVKQALLDKNWLTKLAPDKKLRILLSDDCWQNDAKHKPYYKISEITTNPTLITQLKTQQYVRVVRIVRLHHQDLLSNFALNYYMDLLIKLKLVNIN